MEEFLIHDHDAKFGGDHPITWLTSHAVEPDTVFFKRLYVHFFVHLATRRVVAAACTA
jgi:hypothetical protein